MMIDRDIVRFCSIECRLQQSGELSVGWMVDAWLYAQGVAYGGWYNIDAGVIQPLPTLDDVVNLGRLVEPNVNVGPGFRKVDVRVGWDVKMAWEDVPVAMCNLMDTVQTMTPEEFAREYLEIHPWRDGNGRTSVILYNWLRGSLDDPIWFPNWWNDPRRTVGYGA